MSRRVSRFFKALGYFTFVIIVFVVLAIAGIYTIRDEWLRPILNREVARQLGYHQVTIERLITRPVGAVSIEVEGLVFQKTADTKPITAQKITLSTPQTAFDIYRLYETGGVLPLKIQAIGLDIAIPPSQPEQAAQSAAANDPASSLPPIPMGLDLEVELRDGKITLDGPSPLKISGTTGFIRLQAPRPAPASPSPEQPIKVQSQGQLALNLGLGEKLRFPLRTSWKLDAETPDLKTAKVVIDSMEVQAFGVNIRSKGSAEWPSQTVAIEASGASPDLGILPLEKNESEALGIAGRMQGSAEVALKLTGSLKEKIKASGHIKASNVIVPLGIEKPQFDVKGPLKAEIDSPYEVEYDFAQKKMLGLNLPAANFKVDLTETEIFAPGYMKKPSATRLTASGQFTAEGETFNIDSLQFALANLTLGAKGRVSTTRPAQLEVTASLPSLIGWPKLLPIMGTFDNTVGTADLNRANGSIQLKAEFEGPLHEPKTLADNFKLSISQLDMTGVEFPVNWSASTTPPKGQVAAEKKSIKGLAKGSLSATATIASVEGKKEWSIQKASGQWNLRDLEIEWSDLFRKTATQELTAAFTAKGDAKLIRLDSLDVRGQGLNFTAKGTVGQKVDQMNLDLTLGVKAALTGLYQHLPSLRTMQAKVPSGQIDSNIKLAGVFQGSPATSPLAATGKLSLRLPKVVILETKKDAKGGAATPAVEEEKPTEYLEWPITQKSKIDFDVLIDAFTYGNSTFKTVSTVGKFGGTDEVVKGSAKIADAFGGAVVIPNYTASSPNKTLAGLETSLQATFARLNLSALADHVDPSYKTLVGGLATGSMNIKTMPLGTAPLTDVTTATGAMKVDRGFLSTVSLDQLVNEKLASIPGIGADQKLNSKGVTADMNSQFTFKEKTLNLADFRFLTPEKNELKLAGWMKLDFTVGLQGEAFLATAPVGGSFRSANSDATGRLRVPIKIDGSLKSPNLSIAQDAIAEMTKRMVDAETKKLQGQVKKEADKLIDQKKNEAVDRIKEELKKRGLGF